MNPLSKFGLTDMELDAEIARDPRIATELEKLAHEVEAFWKGLAPVFSDDPKEHRKTPPNGEAGDYRDSIQTEMIRGKDDHISARVGTNDYKAVWIEFGSAHMPEYAPATKTAHHFGDTRGPIVSVGGFSQNINEAQKRYSEARELLEKLTAEDASADRIKEARSALNRARGERSAAFNANRPRRRGRR